MNATIWNMNGPADTVEMDGSSVGSNELDAYGMTLGVKLVGQGQHNTLFGGSGPDSLYGGSGGDYLYGENNSDILYFTSSTNYYNGTGSTTLVYPAPPNVNVALDGEGLWVWPNNVGWTSGYYVSLGNVGVYGIGRLDVQDGTGTDKAYYGGFDGNTLLANVSFNGNGNTIQGYTFSWSQAMDPYTFYWTGGSFSYYSPLPSYGYIV